MSRLIILILMGIIIGTGIGYVIFAQTGNGYIPVNTLISIDSNQNPETFEGVVQSIGTSLEEIVLDLKTRRRNIIIFGLAGGLLGAFTSVLFQRRKR